jgi:hypothetical protein
VENEPDVAGLLGGLPRLLPLDEPLLFDQADETAGPCLRRERLFSLVDGVMADRGSTDTTESDGWFPRGIIAD